MSKEIVKAMQVAPKLEGNTALVVLGGVFIVMCLREIMDRGYEIEFNSRETSFRLRRPVQGDYAVVA